MQILRAADRRAMAWKNGGGVTYEVFVSPEGAGLDAFDWRVSMARLQSDGPFSRFEGISRVLAMLEGEVTLKVGEAEPRLMGPGSPPLAFAGDAAVYGALVSAEALDLNVMTRSAAFEARVSRGAAAATLARRPGVDVVMLASLGDLALEHRDAYPRLARLDVALWRDDEPVQVSGSGGYWLIEIVPRTPFPL